MRYVELIVPIVLLVVVASIVFVLRSNRPAGVTRTIPYVIGTLLYANFAWNFWSGWHTSSGNEALLYLIAFVLACVAVAAFMTVLGRRMWWLRHNPHDGEAGQD